MFGYVALCTTSFPLYSHSWFRTSSTTWLPNHAPSTLLTMSTARHQMSPHILPSPLQFGLLPPSRPQCYVSSLPYQQGPVVRVLVPCLFWLILLNIIGLSSNTRSSLICTMLDFILCLLPDLNKNGRGHPRSRAACMYFCQSIPIIHFLPPN